MYEIYRNGRGCRLNGRNCTVDRADGNEKRVSCVRFSVLRTPNAGFVFRYVGRLIRAIKVVPNGPGKK